MFFGFVAISDGAQQAVRCTNQNRLRTLCRSMKTSMPFVAVVNSKFKPWHANSHEWPGQHGVRTGSAKILSPKLS